MWQKKNKKAVSQEHKEEKIASGRGGQKFQMQRDLER